MLDDKNIFLYGSHLMLRPLATTDTPQLGRILCDPRVVFWRSRPYTKNELRVRIRHSINLNKKGLGWWLIFARSGTRELLGSILLQPLAGTHEIEIGYHIHPRHWGKGIATRAARLVLQHGFDKLELSDICAVVLPRNTRSLRVVEKLNMKQRGTHLHADLKHRYFTLKREVYEGSSLP